MSLHRRQFIIANRKVEIRDFECIRLDKYLYLNYHKELNYNQITNINNEKIILLGYAFQTDPTLPSPIVELEKKSFTSIQECYSSWSGRWVLIYNNEIHLDAGGTLGVFYKQNQENQKIVISSSLALISEIENQDINPNISSLSHQVGMDWYPGPSTVLEGVGRLLPCQVLLFTQENIFIKNNTEVYKNYSKISLSERYNLLVLYLITLMQNIEKEYPGQILLPLTAGYDSRTLLSILLKSKINFSSYTLKSKRMSSSDKKLPLKLSKKFNFKHELIKKKDKICDSRLEQFDKHTFYSCIGIDRTYYGANQYPQSKNQKTLVLRGGIWEIGRQFYHGMKIANQNKLENIQDYFGNIEKDSFHYNSLKQWLVNIENNPLNISWTDRFYLEQRVGCWLSSIEQALDLTDLDRIHPINSHNLIALLMSISEEDSDAQKNIIKIMEPKLLCYPFNKKNIIDYLNKGLLVGGRILKHQGAKRLFYKIKLKVFN